MMIAAGGLARGSWIRARQSLQSRHPAAVPLFPLILHLFSEPGFLEALGGRLASVVSAALDTTGHAMRMSLNERYRWALAIVSKPNDGWKNERNSSLSIA